MRILILCQFFDPEPTFKGMVFAKALASRGHEVEVLTGVPNYPGGKIYPGYRVRLWQHEMVDGIRVNRVALYPSHDGSALRRILNYGSFALTAAMIGPFLVKKPDVVYVYHPPATIGLPALILRTLRGCPFVYDVQDLWPDTVTSSGMMRSPILLSILSRFCRFVYRSADRLVVLSPGFRRILIERGLPAERIRVIYNWADESSIRSRDQDLDPAISSGLAGRFNIMFAGTMGKAQALDAVLDAAQICQESVPQAQFVFLGGGVEKDRLEQRSRESNLSNVLFLPRQPMSAMGPVLALADVLLVHLKDDPLFQITIPSKTQAYLAAGRPILMAVAGDAADLVVRSRAGVTCDPENAIAIAANVKTLYEHDCNELVAMGERGKSFYDRELSVDAGVKQFEQVFWEAVGKPAPAEVQHSQHAVSE